jgi:hypothetical protein
LLHSSEWTTEWVKAWYSENHMNVLEGQTARRWEEEMAKIGDIRPTAIVDSRVTLCSSVKGRTPSTALTVGLRRRSALLLGGGSLPLLPFQPYQVQCF